MTTIRKAAEQNPSEPQTRSSSVQVPLVSWTHGQVLSPTPSPVPAATEEAASLFSMQKVYGYIQGQTLEERRTRLTDALPPADAPRIIYTIQRSLQEQSSYSVKYCLAGHSDLLIWETGNLVQTAQGEPVINGVMLDVTELRKFHDTLRRQRDFFQSHYDSLPCGIVRFFPEENPLLLHANKHAFKLTGYTPEDVPRGIRFMDNVHPEDKTYVQDKVAHSMGEGSCEAFIYRVLRKDGEVRWFNAMLNMVTALEQSPMLQLVVTDVTEAMLLQRERQLTYESLPGGVVKVLVDKGIRVLEGNNQFYAMVGAQEGKHHFRPLEALLPADRLDMHFALLENAAKRLPLDTVYRCRRLDNDKLIWLRFLGRFVERRGNAHLYQFVVIDVTGECEARLQLEKEQERFRLIMELSSSAVYEYDVCNDCLTVFEDRGNKQDIHRHTCERFLAGLDVHCIVHPEDAELTRRIMKGQESGEHEVRFRPSHDVSLPYVWCLVQSRTVYENGQPVRTIGSIKDIGNAHAVQEQKKEILSVLQHELSRDYESVLLLDTNTGRYTTLLATTPYFMALPPQGDFAVDSDHIIRSYVHPQDRDQLRRSLSVESMRRTLCDGVEEDSQYFRLVYEDGRVRWKCIRYSSFRNNSCILLVNVRDVHDIRMAQQREAARFNMILRESCEKVMEVDLDTGEYKMFTLDASTRYPLDYCPTFDDLVRNYSEKYVIPEEKEEFIQGLSRRAILQHARISSRGHTLDFTVLEADGTHSYKSWHSMLCRHDGRDYLLSYIRDVTGRVLELREKERETDKNRRIIIDALDTARQANKAKSQFLSKMSHEIRTPMNAILGMGEIMSHCLDDKVRLGDCLGKMHASSRYLLALLNDILDMSRIESGKLALVNEPFSLDELLTQVATLMEPQAREKNIRFTLDLDDLTPLNLMGDSLRIRQILLNLISNAIKFTEAGGRTRLAVREVSRSHRQSRLNFCVSDTGIGIAEDKIKRIFEPFEQISPKGSVEASGSGVGLSLTRSLVQLMRGQISAESMLGEGSRFTVELTLSIAEVSPLPTDAPLIPERKHDFKGRRVLVAEDNDLNMEIATTLLEFTQAEVHCASDGKECLEKFADSKPGFFDLVLMDIQMPVMDGMEATRRIRALRRTDARQVPIIAMTALAFAEDIAASRACGMNEHLAKPIEVQKLYHCLSQYFEKADQAQEQAANGK